MSTFSMFKKCRSWSLLLLSVTMFVKPMKATPFDHSESSTNLLNEEVIATHTIEQGESMQTDWITTSYPVSHCIPTCVITKRVTQTLPAVTVVETEIATTTETIVPAAETVYLQPSIEHLHVTDTSQPVPTPKANVLERFVIDVVKDEEKSITYQHQNHNFTSPEKIKIPSSASQLLTTTSYISIIALHVLLFTAIW